MRRLALLLAMLVSVAGLHADPVEPVGTWYLNGNGYRTTATINPGGSPGTYTGTLVNENGGAESLTNITWEDAAKRLQFRRNGSGFWQWYRGRIVDGVYVGRFSHSGSSSAMPSGTAYSYHVTGWNRAVFDSELAPRVWEVLTNANYRGRLRIDRASTASGFAGRLKIYSTIANGEADEEPEYDLEVTEWNGTTLKFTRRNPAWTQQYTGTVSGRTITGTYNHNGAGSYPWNGTRAEVLTYGYGMYKGPVGRANWQARTRRQLAHLTMSGNPAPASAPAVIGAPVAPIAPGVLPPERDDNPSGWPQSYTRREINFSFTFPPDQHGNTPATRSMHGWLSVPTTPAPPGGRYPAVLAVNGHGGSAWKMMDPSDHYFWYGDSFARRGFIVLAIDISHRPAGDRQTPGGPLYGGYDTGDDPAHGNGLHPAIKAAGYNSDWEEDGERAWDAMRGIDYLISRADVDASRIVVTGLSMGGEVATIVGGLDPRVAVSIPAGYSPDLGLMLQGNHECWKWIHADIREYVDTSDYYALTAPRPLIIQTGKADFTFSVAAAPFGSDKEVARRARVAYGGETANVLHYLHYDEHHYHAGDVNPSKATEQDVRIPEVIAPTSPWSHEWVSDARTFAQRCTLFECVAFFLRQKK